MDGVLQFIKMLEEKLNSHIYYSNHAEKGFHIKKMNSILSLWFFNVYIYAACFDFSIMLCKLTQESN